VGRSRAAANNNSMSDRLYPLDELRGESSASIEDAVNRALGRVGTAVKDLNWFQLIETRGLFDIGKVKRWLVRIKVGFTAKP
jgi:flavin-binding protein dodecin